MAKEMLLWLFLSNLVFVVIYGASLPPPTTTTVPVMCLDEQDGTTHAPGDTWNSGGPCTQCECTESGESMCMSQACLPPRCYDSTTEEGQCCPTCPNGENCKTGDTVIPKDESRYMETGEECWCEETGYGELEAVCSLPPPPPPTTTPPSGCTDDSGTYENGESWRPDPCTWCDCIDGEVQCAMASVLIPRCVDPVQNPDQCGPSCPNGENCQTGSTIIPNGETVILDSGEECRCEDNYDTYELQAVCSLPPPMTTPPTPYCYDPSGVYTTYTEGDSWHPDPCTWCSCEHGQVMCYMAGCMEPNCVDPAHDPTECCPTCPNGENCKMGDTIIPIDETRYMETGEECWCEQNGFSGLEAVCSLPPPLPPTSTPSSSCTDYSGTYENGESWSPDPCTWCDCIDGQVQCAMASVLMPRCVDPVQNPDECGPSCPNGENCQSGSTIIPNGESVILEGGEECWCEEDSNTYELHAVCSLPPPPPPPTSTPTPYCHDPSGIYTTYQEGDNWQPDPCTWCSCENGEVMCAVADCFPPNCVDATNDPTQCCATCPNGPNCQYNDEIIPFGVTVTLDDGQSCHCEGEEWGPLEAVCVLPPSPPPTTTPTSTTVTPPTTLSPRQARQQAKKEERKAKREATQQAKQEARQAKAEQRQAKKEERQAKREKRQAGKGER